MSKNVVNNNKSVPRAADDDEDSVPLVIEREESSLAKRKRAAPVGAAKGKPATTPLKSAKKKTKKDEEEQDEEDIDSSSSSASVNKDKEEAVGQKKDKEKKTRVRHPDRPHGSRLATAQNYRSKLDKDRKKRRESGSDPAQPGQQQQQQDAKRRNKPCEVTKREAAFYAKTNGLFINSAVAGRLLMKSVGDTLPYIQDEAARVRRRLSERNKPIPAALNPMPFGWRESGEAVQLARACLHVMISEVAEVAHQIQCHTKRDTMTVADVALACSIIDMCK